MVFVINLKGIGIFILIMIIWGLIAFNTPKARKKEAEAYAQAEAKKIEKQQEEMNRFRPVSFKGYRCDGQIAALDIKLQDETTLRMGTVGSTKYWDYKVERLVYCGEENVPYAFCLRLTGKDGKEMSMLFHRERKLFHTEDTAVFRTVESDSITEIRKAVSLSGDEAFGIDFGKTADDLFRTLALK